MATPPEPRAPAVTDGVSDTYANSSAFRIALTSQPFRGDDRGFTVVAGTARREGPGQTQKELLRGLSRDPAAWQDLEQRLTTMREEAQRTGNLAASVTITARDDNGPGPRTHASFYSNSSARTLTQSTEQEAQARRAFDKSVENLIGLVRELGREARLAQRQARLARIKEQGLSESVKSTLDQDWMRNTPSPDRQQGLHADSPFPQGTKHRAWKKLGHELGIYLRQAVQRALRRLDNALATSQPAALPTPKPRPEIKIQKTFGVTREPAQSARQVPAIGMSHRSNAEPSNELMLARRAAVARMGPAYSNLAEPTPTHLERFGGYYEPKPRYTAAQDTRQQVPQQDRPQKQRRQSR